MSKERFCTSTEKFLRLPKIFEGVPPVAFWYHAKMDCMNETSMMPILHMKFCVQDWAIGGISTAVMPTMACA